MRHTGTATLWGAIAAFALMLMGPSDKALSASLTNPAPALLSAVPDWVFESDQQAASLGAVFGAGDVNGDGFADVIVGAGNYDNTLGNQGRAWLFLGSPSQPFLTPQWSFDGALTGEQFGAVVSAAGDVNGDGFDDVIVGSPFYSGSLALQGRAYLFYGSATGLSPTPGWTATGVQARETLGAAVASAGDVNGDGFDDVIVGAPGDDGQKTSAGRVLVYLGSGTGLSPTPAWIVDGKQADALLGGSVASAGDVNGDGYSDVIVGARLTSRGKTPEAGRAFVYLGSATGLAKNPQWSPYGDQGGTPGAQYGSSVASAGDVNGDGYSDVIVGAFLYDNGEHDEGRAYLYYGSATGVTSNPAWAAESNVPDARFGTPAHGNLDLNGDGYSDVIVGAPYAYQQDGRVFVYLGSASGLSSSADQILVPTGSSGSLFGTCAPAGDVDGDGFDDVIVAAQSYSNGQSQEGAAFLYRGSN